MLPQAIQERIQAVLGRAVLEFHPARGGYTQALRGAVRLDDGTTAFVKAATDPLTAGWLRAEFRMYAALAGEPFLPHCLAREDPGGDALPLLLLEDLSGAHWPPPWSAAQVAALHRTLARVHGCGTLAPDGLGCLEDDRPEIAGWARVADAPDGFLQLGFCGRAWLEAALPTLIDADRLAPLDGDDLCHVDVRSDNVCFRADGGAVLVDWNWARLGNGAFDVAAWLPSLHAEGGPPPETLLPDAGPLAGILAGFWAWNAALPAPPTAPYVRLIQRRQLTTALPWAARALGLRPP
jgi:hypothetical protein